MAPMEAKGREGHDAGNNEMMNMNQETPVFAPPVVLDNYEDFESFAKRAAVIVYTPEYFQSPFLEDQKKLRRVTLAALGVRVNGVALTFKHVLDYRELIDRTKDWDEQTSEVDKLISQAIQDLSSLGTLVRGTLETEPALGELLAMRP
ncbi:MAG: hypothetical protein ACFE7R_04845 [Candidatus Hodarchaeota archaeon]